ncbi:MAG: MMPL family transporter, partial [Actinomycetota bacterium]|nr:MMPL family transporter [Actinomycetota bacterium]
MTRTTNPRAPQAPSANRRGPRRDRLIVLVWLAVLLGGGAAGAVVFDRLSTALDPAAASESMQVRSTLEAATGQADTIIALVTSAPARKVENSASQLRALPGVHSVRGFAEGQLSPPDGGGTVLAVTLRAGQGDNREDATIDGVAAAFDAYPAGQVLLGGYPIIDRELGETAEADLALAEAIAVPIVLLLLGVAVRSLLGSVIGLTLVLTTVTGAFAVLLALSAITTVSTFAINVVTMFGIGLAVDYGLLLITRFRRERAGTDRIEDAVAATLQTAGRTVVFSGVTVAVALAGLLVFAEPIVKSMAYGGIGAVAVAVAASVTLMPVLLRRLGHRIPPISAEADGDTGRGFGRLARLVQRRPITVAITMFAVLAGLALPLAGLRLEGLDARALPASSTARQHTEALEQRLPGLARTPITVLAQTALNDPALAGYVEQLRSVRNVDTVTPRLPAPAAGLAVIDVTVAGPSAGRDAMAVVDDIRSLRPDFSTQVGGLAARDRDFIASLLDRAPYAAAVIVLATFVILLLVTGGVLVAAKAVLMNLASLAASLGALVWIFQEGHLAGALGFTATGGLELLIVLLAAVFAFGLSTDYEVFLLSAIIAARRDGADTDTAVATGITRTGWI